MNLFWQKLTKAYCKGHHSALISIFCALCLISCGTLLGGGRETFVIESEPPGAAVKRLGGRLLGYTPLTFSLPGKASPGSAETLVISMPGFRSAKIKIKPEFNKNSMFNVLFTSSSSTFGAPSFTTDNANGKLFRYTEGSYVLEMKKKALMKMSSAEEVMSKEDQKSSPLQEIPTPPQESKEDQQREELNRKQRELEFKQREIELERDRIRLESEIERQQELEKQQELDKQKANPNQSKEDQLIEEMKRRYEEQLKRREQKQLFPGGIEISPISSFEVPSFTSPSFGALQLSISRFHMIQEEIARGGGASIEELYLRLSLAEDQPLSPSLIAKNYPVFLAALRKEKRIIMASHGLELFRALKPIRETLVSAIKMRMSDSQRSHPSL